MKNTHRFLLGFVAVLMLISSPGVARSLPDSLSVSLYPNPSNGEFRIEVKLKMKAKVTARLFDMTGKLVKDLSKEVRWENEKVTGDIRLEEFSPGLHFITVESGGHAITKKIIIR